MILTAMLMLLVADADKAGAEPRPERKICRSEVPAGSILMKTTCHTRAEWSQIDGATAGVNEGSVDRLRNSTAGRMVVDD